MTREALNKFIADTESAMTEAERTEWFALSRLERMSIAWRSFQIIHGNAL